MLVSQRAITGQRRPALTPGVKPMFLGGSSDSPPKLGTPSWGGGDDTNKFRKRNWFRALHWTMPNLFSNSKLLQGTELSEYSFFLLNREIAPKGRQIFSRNEPNNLKYKSLLSTL